MASFGSDLRILLIEDSEIDYLITEALLKKALPAGFDLKWVSNCSEGLEQLLQHPPDVALIDYFLNEETGVDLIHDARAQDCRVPMILLTAKEDYETDLLAMQAGADEFLVKRLLNPALIERVLRYVTKVHRQREEILSLNQQLEQRVNTRTAELISANYALQESERRVELLKEVASVSNAAASIEEAFMETLASVSHYTGWPLGHVAMVQNHGEDAGNLFSTDIWYQAESQRYRDLIEKTKQVAVFGPDSMVGKVLTTGRPVWLDFSSGDSKRFPRSEVALKNHLRSLIAIPVSVGEQVIAALEFFSHELEVSSDVMLQLMSEVSQQLGYVIKRKQAEAALKVTEKRLNQAQHIARMGNFVFNAENELITGSAEFYNVLKLPPEPLSFASLLALIHPDDYQRALAAFNDSVTQKTGLNLDFRMNLRDHSTIHVQVNAENEDIAQSTLNEIIGVIQDISERKRIEQDLVRLREGAESANQAKSAFLASMSHEIRTPMNAILGFAQILMRDKQILPHQRQHLTTIMRSGEHLLGLINDILEVSKIESGRVTLHHAPFGIEQLLQDVEAMFAEKVRSKRLSLSFDLAEDVPRYLLTDEGKLRQVLINLLSNAVKFTDQGKIVVRVRQRGQVQASGGNPSHRPQSLLYWEVEDTGCGIAPHELDKVFSSFEQTASGIRSQTGTGLGMSISRSYVQMMGGHLNLRSKLHQGTCFYFELPVALAEAEVVNAREHPRRITGLAPGQHKPKILLVDDRETNLELLQEMLHPLGFETHTAVNGLEAVKAFESWSPAAILMDAAMPELDGLEATRRIRRLDQGREIPIISVSASAFEHDRASILAAGATDFLAKPVREQDLLNKLQELLQLHFLYEDDLQTSTAETKTELSLDGLDHSLKAELETALHSGDLDRLAELTEHFSPEFAAQAEHIRELVQNFAYDQLNQLFQGAPA